MISEVDIRDWDRIDIVKARDICAIQVDPEDQWDFLEDFFNSLMSIKDKQMQLATKQVAALLRKKDE
jgi:hypothetical protein